MKASKPYFSHDIATKSDEKIIRLMFDFRKNKKKFSEHSLRELLPHAVYGVYWEIIEYLHENTLKVDELEMLSDVIRVDIDILEKILNDYDLFKIKDGTYISERVLRNLKLQEEKSEKAKASIKKRWKKKQNEENDDNTLQEPEYNEEVTMSIIQIYNEKFKKSQIVSDDNKHRIFNIHQKNNLSLDMWNKIFSNAKRGWDIGDKKNVKPNLSIILDKWDSFASDDYFLAPDREEIAAQKEQEQIKKEEEKIAQRKIIELKNAQREEFYNSINSKEDALEYMCRYCPTLKINNDDCIKRNSTYKELSEKFDISLSEFKDFRTHFSEQENEVDNG